MDIKVATRINGEIIGVQFFEKYENESRGYGCMLITSPNIEIPGVGYMLVEDTLKKMERGYIVTGVNPLLERFNSKLGLTMKRMNKYILVNKNRITNELVIYDKSKRTQKQQSGFKFTRITNERKYMELVNNLGIDGGFRGHKKKCKTYFNNPYIKYEIWYSEESQELFVGRKRYNNGSYIVKIVDYISNERNSISLQEYAWELFRDRYCEGIIYYYLDTMEENNIYETEDAGLPEYFSPYKPKVIDIHVAYTRGLKCYIQSIDADQDRASTIDL